MPRHQRPSAAGLAGLSLAAVALIAACNATGSPTPTGPTPTGSPVPTVDPNLIEHPTGSTDLILRFDEAGGFVAPSFFVSQGPAFSLYGDGTVIFRDPTAKPPVAIGRVVPGIPWQVIRLDEVQIQALLEFAIGPGGIGVAKATYELPVADAPTATFTIFANGTRKTVSVNGLGLGADQPGPDRNVLDALLALKTRLATFGKDVAGEAPWVPDRYRGVLIGDGVPPAIAWPWPAIQAAEFIEHRGPTDPPFRLRTLTPADAAALGVKGFEGGLQGLVLQSPDGTALYEFGLRPLWPDEAF